MRAAQITEPGKDFEIVEREIPEPGEGQDSGARAGELVAVLGVGGLGHLAMLLMGKKSILGWYSGHAKDSEETLAFSRLAGVRAVVEVYPLEKVNEAFEKMMNGKPKFRVVLRMDR